MSLRLLLEGLQKGFSGSLVNLVIQVLHGVVEKFDDVDEKQDLEIAAVKEMVSRLEDRVTVKIEEVRGTLERQIDVAALAVDRLEVRVGKGEPREN